MNIQPPMKQMNSIAVTSSATKDYGATVPTTTADDDDIWPAPRKSFWDESIIDASERSGGTFFNALLGMATLDSSLRSELGVGGAALEDVSDKSISKNAGGSAVGAIPKRDSILDKVISAPSINTVCDYDNKQQQQWSTSERAKMVTQSKELQRLLKAEIKKANVLTTSGYKAVLTKFLYSEEVEQEMYHVAAIASELASAREAKAKQTRRSSTDSSFQLFRRLSSLGGNASRRSSMANTTVNNNQENEHLDGSFKCWIPERRMSTGICSRRRSSVSTSRRSSVEKEPYTTEPTAAAVLDNGIFKQWTSNIMMGRRVSDHIIRGTSLRLSAGSTSYYNNDAMTSTTSYSTTDDDIIHDILNENYSRSNNNLAPRRPSHPPSLTDEDLNELVVSSSNNSSGHDSAAEYHHQGTFINHQYRPKRSSSDHRRSHKKTNSSNVIEGTSNNIKIITVDFDPQDMMKQKQKQKLKCREENRNDSDDDNMSLRTSFSSAYPLSMPSNDDKEECDDGISNEDEKVSDHSSIVINKKPLSSDDESVDDYGWLSWPTSNTTGQSHTEDSCIKSIGSCCTEDSGGSFMPWPVNPHEYRHSGIIHS